VVASAIGDEPYAAFAAVFFLRWVTFRLALAIMLPLLLLGILSRLRVVPTAVPDTLAKTLLLGMLFVIPTLLFFATAIYGFVLALVALDSPIAVTPAPGGRCTMMTIFCKRFSWLKHWAIYEQPEAIAAVVASMSEALRVWNHNSQA
jgi:hypothetical protein